MKKTMLFLMFSVTMMLISSCGSSKKATADNYYSNPQRQEGFKKITEGPKRETKEIEKIAAAEIDNLRAVGIGNDTEEKYAKREAIRDAYNTLAGFLETAVINLAKEYHKRATVDSKKYSETNLEEYVETSVAQKIGKNHLIGLPETYEMSDGTVNVYVCIELDNTKEQVLGDLYDQLTKDEILGTDYDKQKFIQDNKDELDKLRKKRGE